ncbi:cell division protein FtsQ/DivIB [Nocardia mangyaensis]|uniref:cell division protein FtsQ/DivIB n=1 Tax=Nocardia mangyaensis TaxID=2213200 RepID=UPI002674F4C5|nr:FtsQ-type POTRA domain-containing protein [Nocardia mangyaensis]MDO3649993.1 FtsQ-type POTRA domain-containing protein [Nocardia mangyaensis]
MPAARGWHGYRLWTVVGVLVVTVIAVLAWFTPALSVRTVQIDGLSSVPEQEVRVLLEIPEGRSMLRIDTTEIAQRVAAIPKVRSVRVQRKFPSTVAVTVVERTPVVYVESPDGVHLIDADSVEFAIEPAVPIGVPELVTDEHFTGPEAARAAVDVLVTLPPALSVQVGEVVARSNSDVSLNLRDGRKVVWGGTGDGERKAAVVMPLLTREGTVFDVSSPNLVTVK